MSNEHPPRIPYIKHEDPMSSWQDLKITASPRSFKTKLLSTTSPLDSEKTVGDLYEQSKAWEFQDPSLHFTYDPYSPESAENIKVYLDKVKDLLFEWEAEGGFRNSDENIKAQYKQLTKTIAKLEALLGAQEKTLENYTQAAVAQEDAYTRQLEERAKEVASKLEEIGDQYERFLSVEEVDQHEDVVDVEERAEPSAEDLLLGQYLTFMGHTEDQILAALNKGQGRDRLLRNAQEWQLRDEESPFGKIHGKIERAAVYIQSVKGYVPEEMSDRYQTLQNYLESEVKPALDAQESFLKGESAVDGLGTLETMVRVFLDEVSSFSDDLVGLQEGGLEAASGEVSPSKIEEEIKTKKTGWWDKDFQKEQGVFDENGVVPTQKWGDQDGPIGFEPPAIDFENGKERTGWWDKDFQVAHGQEIRNIDGTLNQRWGENSDDIGFKPEPIAAGKEEGRTGWWNDEYREDRGFAPSVPEGPLTQRGDLSVPDSLNTDRFVSEPVSGGRTGQVKWSVQEAEGLPSEPVTADSLTNEPEATPPEEGTMNVPMNPAYEQVRQEWMGAKAEHEIKRQEYLNAVDGFYKNWSEEISNKGFFGKIGSSIKAKFGFKPDLPEEVLALREASFAATESYGQKAREMTEKRELAGKKSRGEISEAMLERYNRRFGHEAVFNTFKAQVESQAAAAESLGFKPGKITAKLIKHKNALKLVGAFALGTATGTLAGVIAGGAWWARSTAGGAAAVGVAGLANKKWTADINRWSEEQQEAEVRSLATKINDKSLTKEELSEQYGKLEAILAQVDEKNRAKMLKVIAAAGLTGALVGGAVGAIGEGVFGTGAEVEAANGNFPSTDGPASADARVTGSPADASPETTAQPGDAGEQAATADAETPEYVAQKGDNFWDIMEGETEAVRPSYLDHIDASHEQELIDLVRDRIEQDPVALRDLGFGENADQLQIGAEVDTERLNEIAEEIAKEKGWYVEAAPDAVEAPQAPETPLAEAPQASETLPVDADQPKVLDAKVAPEAAVVANVSPDKNYDFAHSYPEGPYLNGFQNFRHDFQTQWVDRIQGPPPVSGGFLASFFSSAPLSDSAYNEFDAWDVGDFKKLATYDESVLASRLTAENIDMADYLAWRDEIAKWEQEGLVIDPKDRFSDVAETAFINSLEKAKAV